jgi:ABC-type dipeptide/oligopeptide/nickel transport system ATPase component
METLLSIQNLTVQLMTARGIVYALSGVDMDMKYGEILGVVGESGCGKSMTAKSIMRLHPPRRTRVSGAVLFEGRDLLALPNREMEKLRGSEISMIFQDPMTSLNPLMTVGNQLGEMFRYHMGSTPAAALEQSEELLQKVGLSPAKSRLRQYPFELSGGMQQRVMIAMASACKP